MSEKTKTDDISWINSRSLTNILLVCIALLLLLNIISTIFFTDRYWFYYEELSVFRGDKITGRVWVMSAQGKLELGKKQLHPKEDEIVEYFKQKGQTVENINWEKFKQFFPELDFAYIIRRIKSLPPDYMMSQDTIDQKIQELEDKLVELKRVKEQMQKEDSLLKQGKNQ